MRRIKGKFILLAMGLLFTLIFLSILDRHQVNLHLTASDREVFEKLSFDALLQPQKDSLELELKTIVAVQKKALELSPIWEGIPMGETREPVDLVREGRGICYDRSRFIEKALRYLEFETRHVALYELLQQGYLKSISSKGIASHSATEVKTSQGWMFVDSNSIWISLADDGQPISLRQIQEHGLEPYFSNRSAVPDIFKAPFLKVYGLYSRHGKFYPPFNSLPDVSYQELMSNLL